MGMVVTASMVSAPASVAHTLGAAARVAVVLRGAMNDSRITPAKFQI